jgi:ABC-type multidrug transport system ATPase subunit
VLVSDVFYCVNHSNKFNLIQKFLTGKTTLLNALNFRYQNDFIISGDIRLNGELITSYDKISSNSGYVQQTDLFFSTLTVKEHLKFQVNIKNLKTNNKFYILIVE